MPWGPSDAKRHNKAATGKKARQWSDVANSVLQRTGDDGLAVREANGVIKRRGGRGTVPRGEAHAPHHREPRTHAEFLQLGHPKGKP